MTETLLVLGAVVLVFLAAGAVFLRGERARAEALAQMTQLAEAARGLSQAQAELGGKMQMVQSLVNERLEGLSKRLGDGLTEQTEKTGKTLQTLNERLAVIDAAQKNLTDLSRNVVDLQAILGNKQARGAFGQVRLEDLVSDNLPTANFAFEATLSNGTRVDCLIRLPNPPGSIGIDSKFPLEAYQALMQCETDEQAVKARRVLIGDVQKHSKAISEKYIIPGETADWALMFLPSEAIYCEIQANFYTEIVEDAHRRKVAIVSPTSLWATLNTVRAVLKDARMREQADLIQKEVGMMLKDVGLLDKRVGNLQRHFDQTTEDLREIRTSSERITKRGEKIKDASLEEAVPATPLAPPPAQ
jgi:DNA recombination protein RmuC